MTTRDELFEQACEAASANFDAWAIANGIPVRYRPLNESERATIRAAVAPYVAEIDALRATLDALVEAAQAYVEYRLGVVAPQHESAPRARFRAALAAASQGGNVMSVIDEEFDKLHAEIARLRRLLARAMVALEPHKDVVATPPACPGSGAPYDSSYPPSYPFPCHVCKWTTFTLTCDGMMPPHAAKGGGT